MKSRARLAAMLVSLFVGVAGLWLASVRMGKHPTGAVAQMQANNAPRHYLSITDSRRRLIDKSLPIFNPAEEVEVPFTDFSTSNHKVRLLFRASKVESTIEIDKMRRVSFPRAGVPLKLLELGPDRFAAFFREIFSGKLYLYEIGPRGLHERYLRGQSKAELIFRQAIIRQGKVLAVLYDNDKMTNDVYSFSDIGSDAAPTHIATLATVEDPAGTHYEMMPSVFLLPQGKDIWIVSGTLAQFIGTSGAEPPRRLKGCQRSQEAVMSSEGPIVLCLAPEGAAHAFAIAELTSRSPEALARPIENASLVWNLRAAGKPEYSTVQSADDIAALLRFDLTRNHGSGAMELGMNNIEGRVAWSQIYFLNGLLDLVRTARSDNDAFDRFGDIAPDAKRRLDIEIYLLNRLLQTPDGFRTEAFTFERAPVLYAVQTSRLLLLFNRYAREVQNGSPLSEHAKLAQQVIALSSHIDVLTKGSPGMRSTRSYLHWPRGSGAFFDGVNVPYNHQNEWAYSVTDTLRDKSRLSPTENEAKQAAAGMIAEFLEAVAPGGAMPDAGEWPYWWGKAEKGWSEGEQVSLHTKAYAGDKSKAFISFRTIDVMSVLGTGKRSEPFRNSVERLVQTGRVYPFASVSFLDDGFFPVLDGRVALHYARLTAPWELQSAVWSLASLPASPPLEDPHSEHLNDAVKERLPSVQRARPSDADSRDVLYQYLSIAIPYNVKLAWRNAGLELGGKILAWNLAYDLDAAATAYERTRDERFLDLLEIGVDAALAMRDDRLGKRDDVRQKLMPAWGTNRYNPDKKDWMAWDAFTGMIAYPALRYARFVEEDKLAGERGKKAKKYRTDMKQAVNAFDAWWRPQADGASYYFDPLYQDVAPLNHMNLLGLAQIELCRQTKDAGACTKVDGLARYFQQHLKRQPDGTCDWEYWAGANQAKYRSTSGEDVTHAYINVWFAVRAFETGHVFQTADMQCMAKTLTTKIMRPQGDWAAATDGTGNLVESGLHEGLSGWGLLRIADPDIPPRIDSFMLSRPAAYPLGLLSYASGPASFAASLSEKAGTLSRTATDSVRGH